MSGQFAIRKERKGKDEEHVVGMTAVSPRDDRGTANPIIDLVTTIIDLRSIGQAYRRSPYELSRSLLPLPLSRRGRVPSGCGWGSGGVFHPPLSRSPRGRPHGSPVQFPVCSTSRTARRSRASEAVGERVPGGRDQREARGAGRFRGIDHRAGVVEVVELLGQLEDVGRDPQRPVLLGRALDLVRQRRDLPGAAKAPPVGASEVQDRISARPSRPAVCPALPGRVAPESGRPGRARTGCRARSDRRTKAPRRCRT